MNTFSDTNGWAVLVAALSTFLLGGLWYGPLFLRPWSRAAGIDPAASPGHPARTFSIAFLCSLASAAAMAVLLPASAGAVMGATLGALVGLFFVAASFGINYAFAQRRLLLWLIDGGYHVVQFALYGAILAVWR
jgi:hypothetical protein